MTISIQITTQKATKKEREMADMIVDLEDKVKQRDDTIKQRDKTIEQQQETIKTLEKQNAKKDKLIMKLYQILVVTITGLKVSPESINECFNVFQKMVKMIENSQQLSQTKIRNTKKKIEIKKAKIEIQTAQAKKKETRQKIIDNPNVPSSKQPDPLKKSKRKPKNKWKKSGRGKGHKGTSASITPDDIRHHKKKECDECGSKNMNNKRSRQKMSIDIRIIILHVFHIGYWYNCRQLTQICLFEEPTQRFVEVII